METEGRRGRVTLLDVAREAGVSRATASLVIRKSPLVAEATRLKVEETLDRLGYVYNMGAASMRASRSNTIGVLIPNLGNPFFADLLSGIEKALEGAGMVVVLANSQDSVAKQEKIIQRMRERGVDGLIVCPAAQTRRALLTKASKWGLPIVQTMRYISDLEGDYAGADSTGGFRQSVDHLVGLGHRRIIFLTGGPMHSARSERLAGFRTAMQAHGLDPGHQIEVPLSGSGPKAAELMLSHPAQPTAAICFNDILAIGLMNGLIDRRIRVPEDISVVGFDDLTVAEMVRPRLTSIAAFPEAIGETSAGLLLDRLAAPDRPSRRIVNLTRLVARQSSGRVKSSD